MGLNYEDFLRQIEAEVKLYVGEWGRVCIFPVKKNNSVVLDRLTILMEKKNVSPAIYLNDYYREYLAGRTVEEIAADIIDCYKEKNKVGSIDTSFYTDIQRVKKRIVCRLVNYEKNRRLLEEVPYQMYLNLAVIYYYQMDCREIGMAAILVKKEHLRMWGIDQKALHDIAVKNTADLFPWEFLSMCELLQSAGEAEDGGGLGIDLREDGQPLPLYVLTNRAKCYGAFWMTDQTVLKKIGEQLQEDYFILPSSVHECMVIPDREKTEAKWFQEMVREINETQVEPEEVLGDAVYRYDRWTGVLRMIL